MKARSVSRSVSSTTIGIRGVPEGSAAVPPARPSGPVPGVIGVPPPGAAARGSGRAARRTVLSRPSWQAAPPRATTITGAGRCPEGGPGSGAAAGGAPPTKAVDIGWAAGRADSGRGGGLQKSPKRRRAWLTRTGKERWSPHRRVGVLAQLL
ncbi:hypothetical protein GCM10027440_53500 [Nocardiopsis coralliicola]